MFLLLPPSIYEHFYSAWKIAHDIFLRIGVLVVNPLSLCSFENVFISLNVAFFKDENKILDQQLFSFIFFHFLLLPLFLMQIQPV